MRARCKPLLVLPLMPPPGSEGADVLGRDRESGSRRNGHGKVFLRCCPVDQPQSQPTAHLVQPHMPSGRLVWVCAGSDVTTGGTSSTLGSGSSQWRGTTKATRYLGYAALLSASAVGDRSLMWVCHITGTPGCSTALCSVPLHCTQARYFARTVEATICIFSERLPDRPQQLSLHSLTAEAEGGYLCCSRTTAVPSSPSQKTHRTKWWNVLPTMPTAAYLVAEGISPTTGPGREGKEKTLWCLLSLHVSTWCVQ